MASATRDLTTGRPLKLILSFMVPIFLGMLFQQFYNVIDTIVVGKFLGVQALAGVGSTGSLNFLVLGLCNGICSGFAIPVAQKFGQRDMEGLKKFIGNMIWLTVVLSLSICLVTTMLCRQFLEWMGNPDDTIGYAYNYIFVIFLAIPVTMLYNLCAGILRSLGNSRTPLYFLVFSSVLNILLDLFCILVLHMGVRGAGIATFISQLISGLLCLRYMKRHYSILHLQKHHLRLEKYYVSTLLSMGLPMGLQYSITAIGSILLQTSVNSLGAVSMAAMTAGQKVSVFASTPFDAIGSCAAIFAGQNLGAGKPERVHEGVKAAGCLGILYSIAAVIVLYFFADDLTVLFLDSTDPLAKPQVLPLAQQFLRTSSLFYIPLLYVNLLRFTIQGLGFSQLAVVAGIFEMVARAVVAICLVPLWGFTAVCFANAAAWILADVFLLPAYYTCLRKRGFRPRVQKQSAVV